MAATQDWFEKDFYSILGISNSATSKEITKAYRALAKKFHPDANKDNKDAAEKFKEITQAYEVIGDEEKRKEYDQIRSMISQNFMGSSAQGNQGSRPFYQPTPDEMGDLSDLLGGLFSRMRQPSNASAHDTSSGRTKDTQSQYDIETQVNISFHQAIDGAVVPVSYMIPNQGKQDVKIKVPPGVNNEQRIKVSGRGLMSHRGKRGDLYVVVSVAEHPWFQRRGRTLMVKVPISYAESVVGTNVKVPTLGDPVTIKVPPKTKSGTTTRVKSRGVTIGDQTGDLLVTFEIAPIKDLSEKELDLYKELVQNQSINPRSKYGLEKQ